MIEIGAEVPAARVWIAPRESFDLRELAEDGGYFLFFYLFDWSST
jgi:hypothetical protein